MSACFWPGSSCPGKTTIAERCVDIDGVVVCESDELGVPSSADLRWRQRMTEEWVQRTWRTSSEGCRCCWLGAMASRAGCRPTCPAGSHHVRRVGPDAVGAVATLDASRSAVAHHRPRHGSTVDRGDDLRCEVVDRRGSGRPSRWPTESCCWLALTMDMKLEVIGIPVSNVDAALTFYTERIGFHLDHDVQPAPGMRVVQMTPPGSSCSVVMGEGMPLGEPGSTKGMQLVVEDIDALRADLAGRGVEITDVQQLGPEGTPGSRFAFFSDLDGNGWSLQEIKRSS